MVAAAAAGCDVVAADIFCDAETRRDAALAIPLRYANGGFDAAQVRQALLPLLTPDTGFVYGSGFEAQPELLDEIGQRCTLFGNPAQTVRTAKDPGRFFSLLANLGIAYPETTLALPEGAQSWLGKRSGGSGGTHVLPLPTEITCDYYQRQVPGRPCSLLFLANGNGAVSGVGYNQQWLAAVPGTPFLYGGAVSQAALPEVVRVEMLDAARRISAALGLRGLNSLDCMVDGESVWVLEVNPRLSASFALYDAANAGAHLFLSHLHACLGELAPGFPPEPARAHLIYYAPSALTFPAAMEWPEWVVDRPYGPLQVRTGDPLCTITADAQHAEAARMLVLERAAELQRRII